MELGLIFPAARNGLGIRGTDLIRQSCMVQAIVT